MTWAPAGANQLRRGAEHDTAFKAERYWPLLDIAQEHDNCEMMIMTSKLLNTLENEPRRDAYFQIAEHLIRPGIAHALEPSFVPWATPFDPWLFHEIALHPTYVGGKVSTLDEPHFHYWAAMCKCLNLPFSPHSGDEKSPVPHWRFGMFTAIVAHVAVMRSAMSSVVQFLSGIHP